ncbi:MAG: S41 family peptidase [Chloroflexota bacterium]
MRLIESLRARSSHLLTSSIVALVFVSGFALGNQYAIGSAQSQLSPPPGSEKLFEPFWQVYNLIQDSYVDPEGDEIAPQALVDGAISGMVAALDDEFSGYMNAETYPLINQELEGEIEGIGVVIRTIPDTGEIEIISVMLDSPAERAGIRQGDIFFAVEGEDVSAMTQLELAQKVRGPEGSEVKLTLKRGDELIDFTVERARIIIPMIESRMLDNNIGYVRLNQFGPQARQEMDAAIEALGGNQLDGLVLDMRGNPGGLLSAAIDISSAFIKDGTILIEDFGNGKEQVFTTNGSYNGLTVPLVVLVDEASASASELVAGALQDNGRATIVGEPTFGKGTVQTWQQLVNGGGIRLTIARWLTPARNWIHSNGIIPDIVVEWNPTTLDEDDDPQLQAAVAHLMEEIAAREAENLAGVASGN